MVSKILLSLSLLAAFAAESLFAAPIITVTPLGLNPSGNRLWNFQVTPDLVIAPGGTPMAVELAFAIDHTDLASVSVNSAVWDTPNPGFNPFTGTITHGLWLDLIGDRTFGAYGSMILTSPAPVTLFNIETVGSGLTTLRYGVAASGDPVRGARIAQIVGPTALNFDGYTGSVTIPEPTSLALGAIVAAIAHFAIRTRRCA